MIVAVPESELGSDELACEGCPIIRCCGRRYRELVERPPNPSSSASFQLRSVRQKIDALERQSLEHPDQADAIRKQIQRLLFPMSAYPVPAGYFDHLKIQR